MRVAQSWLTEILQRTTDLMAQGVNGIVYGRNVVHHPNPKGITQALMAIVHNGVAPEEAIKLI